MTDPERLLTVDDVAQRFGCSRRTVYKLIAEGKLRSLKIAGLRRVKEAEIEAFLRQLA